MLDVEILVRYVVTADRPPFFLLIRRLFLKRKLDPKAVLSRYSGEHSSRSLKFKFAYFTASEIFFSFTSLDNFGPT